MIVVWDNRLKSWQRWSASMAAAVGFLPGCQTTSHERIDAIESELNKVQRQVEQMRLRLDILESDLAIVEASPGCNR